MYTAQWRIIPAHGQLTAVPGLGYHMASASHFLLDMGHGQVVRTLGTIVGGRVALSSVASHLKPASSTRSTLFLIGICMMREKFMRRVPNGR